MTLAVRRIALQPAMATESLDIIGQIRQAEARVTEDERLAEEERKQVLAEAEQQAAIAVEEARERCRREHETALQQAKAEAKELESRTREGAEQAARGVEVVPEERMSKVVDLLIENLRRQWQ